MKVKVTQSHIDAGVFLDCRRCPIALALNDMGCKNVYVGGSRAYISDSEFGFLPIEALKFMSTFDQLSTQHLARPFEFDLNLLVG